jgi:hypothetical protein
MTGLSTALTAEGILRTTLCIGGRGLRSDWLALVALTPEDPGMWHRLGQPEAAKRLGVQRRSIRRVIKQWRDAGVIEVRPAAGRRPTAYRVIGDVERWRDVPWRRAVWELAAELKADGAVVFLIDDEAPPTEPPKPVDGAFNGATYANSGETLMAPPEAPPTAVDGACGAPDNSRSVAVDGAFNGAIYGNSLFRNEPTDQGGARVPKSEREIDRRWMAKAAARISADRGHGVYGKARAKLEALASPPVLSIEDIDRIVGALSFDVPVPAVVQLVEDAHHLKLDGAPPLTIRGVNGTARAVVIFASWRNPDGTSTTDKCSCETREAADAKVIQMTSDLSWLPPGATDWNVEVAR